MITLPNNAARMPALSIRQPWAWLIVNGFKNVENRSWLTNYRGPFLIHAGKKLTVDDYDAAMLFVEAFVDPALVHQVPDMAELPLGGVVGMAKLVDCVTEHPSPWFTGGQANAGAQAEIHGSGYGFVLEQGMPIPFLPWKGRQGFFDVVVKS
ncbi:ASCH domain-containing protein [Polaromonas sp. P2-4]|nr:ASCH domain-containing protein [Polaromonas sp. P2-4]